MLRPDTAALWETIREDPAFSGFVLVGGSALALHLEHRISEDLDLAYLGTEFPPPIRLPRRRLEVAMNFLQRRGASVYDNSDPRVVLEFVEAGMELADYQQDYLVGTVKLSFFTPDSSLPSALRAGRRGGIRLADVDELFASKALVSAKRSKTRDWFDLYYLMTARGFTIADFARVFEDPADHMRLGIALGRLCSGQPAVGDEGYETLLADPPSLEDMTQFFLAQRDRHERGMASGQVEGDGRPPDGPRTGRGR